MRVAAPLGCAALTVEFLAFLLLLKTTIANSLTPWYYCITSAAAAERKETHVKSLRRKEATYGG